MIEKPKLIATLHLFMLMHDGIYSNHIAIQGYVT